MERIQVIKLSSKSRHAGPVLETLFKYICIYICIYIIYLTVYFSIRFFGETEKRRVIDDLKIDILY